MASAFVVCLITSNLFATKVFALGKLTLPAAVIIFPVAYILNDCLAEVWGLPQSSLRHLDAFAMNFLVVILGQVAVWLPAASFWDGAERFDYMFNMAPRVALASLLAFLAGSLLNAFIIAKMKQAQRKGFPCPRDRFIGRRRIPRLLIFMPIAFWGAGFSDLAKMMLVQVTFKVCYEIVILPVTAAMVARLKITEAETA